MSDAGSVLPQEEIDEIFKQATGKSLGTTIADKPVPAPVQQPVKESVTAPSSQSAPKSDDTIMRQVLEKLESLTRRIDSMENEMVFIRESVKPINPIDEDIDLLTEKVDSESQEIRKIKEQIQGISRALKGTPGFNAREQFTCGTCGSKGYLAVPMRCTECGTEGWWGWHPNH